MKTKKYHTPRKEIMGEEPIRIPEMIYHPRIQQFYERLQRAKPENDYRNKDYVRR